jgi:hypothetical protein
LGFPEEPDEVLEAGTVDGAEATEVTVAVDAAVDDGTEEETGGAGFVVLRAEMNRLRGRA